MVTALDTSLGGTNLSTYGFETQKTPKDLMPPISERMIDIPKFNGDILSSMKFNKHKLPCIGTLTGTSYDDLKTKIETLSAFLYNEETRELIFNNQSDRYYNVMVRDKIAIAQKNIVKAAMLIVFTADDPLAYDNTATTDTQADFDTNDDSYTVANAGHTYAYPVITITFNQAQTHIYVNNDTVSNSRFDISKSFETNDELEIDCKNGTVKLNGNADYTGFGDGGQNKANWLKLAVGNNTIICGSDDETIDIDIVMNFRKVYLY